MRPLLNFRPTNALKGLCFLAILISLFTGCSRGPSVADQAAQDGILLLGNGEEPATLDPHLASSVAEGHILLALFEGLVAPDTSNPNKVSPGVASSWEFDPATKTYRFQLRSDARWSDGSSVTAQDFVASAQRALSPSLGSSYPEMYFDVRNAERYYRGELQNFDQVGIRALEQTSLEIELSGPSPNFLQKLKHFAWLPVPVKAIESIGPASDRSTRWAQEGTLVSNGPFQLASWKRSALLEVERNPHYWDKTVSLNGIRFFPYEDAQVESRAFRSEQLHITDKIPTERIGNSDSETDQRSDPFLATSYLIFNTRSPQLANPILRQALAIALDRNSLARDISRSGTAALAFTPAGIEGYDAPKVPEYNPKKARALYQRFLETDARPQLSLLVSNRPESRAIVEAAQAMWSENLGLAVELRNMESKTLFSSLNAGDFEISFLAWTGDYEDPSAFLELWSSDNTKNRARWANQDYDQHLNLARLESDPDKRMQHLADAESVLLDQLPIIPLIWKSKDFYIDSTVKNWPPSLLDMRRYNHVELAN